MELKKNPKYDLTRYSGLFLEVGLVVAISAVLFALNYSVGKKTPTVFCKLETAVTDEEIIPITRMQATTPPPPEIRKVAEVINIVEDDVDIDDIEIEDIEADQPEVTIVKMREEEEVEDEIYIIVEEIPEFPGGEDALHNYMLKHTKYPKNAKKNKVSGMVYVVFVINENGEIGDIDILRSAGTALDREAIRVVRSMPNWIPGKIRGKPVRSLQPLWFDFALR
jgi:protein TonB